MKNFNIMGVHSKIQGSSQKKKQYVGENCLKRGPWTICRFRGGRGLGKKEGVVFLMVVVVVGVGSGWWWWW